MSTDTGLSKKTTEELINEIKAAEDVDDFIEENRNEMIEISLAEYLNRLLNKYNVNKSDVFKKAGMSDTNYGYEIFRGDKINVSRDKLIQICVGFPLTYDETQNVLRLGKVSTLYPRVQRDAYIMFALKNNYDLYQLNDLLFEHGEELIV